MDYKNAWQEIHRQANDALCELYKLNGQISGSMQILNSSDDFEILCQIIDDYSSLLKQIKQLKSVSKFSFING